MKTHLTLRNATLVAALAAVTATAWATNEAFNDNATQAYAAAVAMPPAEPVAAPTETVVTPIEAPAAPAVETVAPAPQRVASEPPIRIEEKAMTVDERIQSQVMDRIGGMQNVSGKVGVESRDATVTLTGLVSTSGQAYRIGKVAYSVDGVRNVDNRIRAKVGGSV